MIALPKRQITAAAMAIAATGLSLTGALPAQAASASSESASCPDVDVVFARGSGELSGLGIVGTPFADSVASDLSGKSVADYAVNYAADFSQTSAGAGATDMSDHITSLAARCANTLFVIGGYSQGASVTDIASGMQTYLGSGTAIPASLSARVVAVVTFGNPIHLTGQSVASGSPTYAPKWDDFCASGDPVCGGGFNGIAHIAYASNGDTTQGAQFAATKVTAAGRPQKSVPHTFHLSDGAGNIAEMMRYAGTKLRHVHIADSFNHKASSGLRYILNLPGTTARIQRAVESSQFMLDRVRKELVR